MKPSPSSDRAEEAFRPFEYRTAPFVTAELKLDGEQEGHELRLASTACEWNVIASGEQIGADVAVEVLAGITAEANALLRNLERSPPHTSRPPTTGRCKSRWRSPTESRAHDTCGCGEPIAYYDGEWMHVYNDQLRGTDVCRTKIGSRC